MDPSGHTTPIKISKTSKINPLTFFKLIFQHKKPLKITYKNRLKLFTDETKASELAWFHNSKDKRPITLTIDKKRWNN